MKIFLTKRGFTLIEILTVIAIIALLASIILASLQTAQSKSRDAKRISDIQNIQLALQTYYNDNSRYPTNIYANGTGQLSPTYISSMPTDPSSSVTPSTCSSAPNTSGCYSYAPLNGTAGSGNGTGNCITYHLGANLEQSSNSALNNDFASSNTSYATQGTCSGIPANSDIDWKVTITNSIPSACPNANSSGSTGYCYDVHS